MSGHDLSSSQDASHRTIAHILDASSAESQMDVESFVDEPLNESDTLVEPRIRFAFFIFGSALLLPWNGVYHVSIRMDYSVY